MINIEIQLYLKILGNFCQSEIWCPKCLLVVHPQTNSYNKVRGKYFKLSKIMKENCSRFK